MKENLRKKLDRTIQKGRKEGFTLVELLVVIAIIAVLATVSVVGYMGFTKKAKVSNDISLTKQMNTALEANKAIKKNNTMSEAVADLEDAGLDVEKLSPTTNGYSYVWDSTSDMMFLLDEKKEVVAPSDKTLPSDKSGVFSILHKKEDALEGYAQYLAADYPEQEVTVTYDVLTSVDTGKSKVKNVSITSTKEGKAIISMNGGTLTFDDAKADVAFYGKADKIDIKNVKSSSFHVYGTASTVEIANGNVELESGSDVGSVIAKDSGAKLNKKNGAKLGDVAYTTSEKPAGIPEGATHVDSTNLDLFAGGIGTEASPYLISTFEQFKNINSLYKGKYIEIEKENKKEIEVVEYKGKSYCFKQINDLVFTDSQFSIDYFTGDYDGDNHKISYSDNIKAEDGYLFGLVFNKVSIRNLTHVLKGNQAISLVFENDWSFDKVDLTFDNVVIDSNGETVKANGSNFGFFSDYAMYNFTKVSYKNCVNKANLNNAGVSTGVFVGSGWFFNEGDDGIVEFKNCANYGNITGTSNVGVLYGNSSYVGVYNDNGTKQPEYLESSFAIDNFVNEGTLTCLYSNGNVGVYPKSNLQKFSNNVNDSKTTILKGGYFDNNKPFVDLTNISQFKYYCKTEKGVSFKVAFNISSIQNKDEKTESNTTRYFYDATYDGNVKTTIKSKTIQAYSFEYAKEKKIVNEDFKDFDENHIGYKVEGENTYLVFDESKMDGRKIGKNGCGYCNVTPYLYAYDSTGAVIGIYNV